jgi:hypothetical protein
LFAELVGRMPVAAGEAAYVRAAFQSDRLATLVWLLVIAISIASGSVYRQRRRGRVPALPEPALIAGVVLAMAGVAASIMVRGLRRRHDRDRGGRPHPADAGVAATPRS